MPPVGPACQHPLENPDLKLRGQTLSQGKGQNGLWRPDNEPQENTSNARKLLILIQPH